jgi:hypothetical protein
MRFINYRSSFLEWTTMFNKSIQTLSLFFMMILSGCGTIIGNGVLSDAGNPDSPPVTGTPVKDTFSAIALAYETSDLADCGSFTNDSPSTRLNIGRQCIRNADTTCKPSKYLYSAKNANGSRFASFVSVQINTEHPAECQIKIRAFSDDLENFIDEHKVCDSFLPNELPELACGVGFGVQYQPE